MKMQELLVGKAARRFKMVTVEPKDGTSQAESTSRDRGQRADLATPCG